MPGNPAGTRLPGPPNASTGTEHLMHTTTRTLAPAAALTIGLTHAGCSTSNAGSSDSSSSSTVGGVDAQRPDVTFTQAMLPHHQQAIEMSDMLLDKGVRRGPQRRHPREADQSRAGTGDQNDDELFEDLGEPTEMLSMSRMEITPRCPAE